MTSQSYAFLTGARSLALGAFCAGVALLAAAPAVAQTPGTPGSPEQQAMEAELKAQVAQLERDIRDAQGDLMTGIKVNGKLLDPALLKREVVYLMGGPVIEAKIADFFIADEIEKRVAAGADPEQFKVSDEELLEELSDMMQEVRVSNPGLDFWEAVRVQYGFSRETFLQQRRQAVLFDRVFFPGKTVSDWPEVTRQSIISNTQVNAGQEDAGVKLLTQLDEASKKVDPKTGEPTGVQPFWLQMLRGFVQKQLKSWSVIEYGSNGLEPEFVVRVNGRTWSTEDAFDFIRQGMFQQDLEVAIKEVVLREIISQKLKDLGHWMSDEDFEAAFATYREQFDSTPFTTELIATKFKGYPSMEAFRNRWRAISSFERYAEAEGMLSQEKMQEYANEHAVFFNNGQVNMELIPFQARDMQTAAWVPGGLDAARQRAEAAWARLENKEIKFPELLNEVGEFFSNDEDRGRPGFKPYNQWRQLFRETEYTDLLMGHSVCRHAFFEVPQGTIIGPVHTADAYYIIRVNSRQQTAQGFDLSDPNKQALVREDFVVNTFLDWANGVVAAGKVERVDG